MVVPSKMTVPEAEEKVSFCVKSWPMVMVLFWVEWASRVPPVMVRSLLMSKLVEDTVKVMPAAPSLKMTL